MERKYGEEMDRLLESREELLAAIEDARASDTCEDVQGLLNELTSVSDRINQLELKQIGDIELEPSEFDLSIDDEDFYALDVRY